MERRRRPLTTEATPESTLARRIGVAAVLLSASVFLSRILGVLRETLIAAYYGAGPAVDAYKASFFLPDLLNHFIAGGALSITFIPMFAAYIARNDEEGGWRLFSTVASTLGTAMLVLTILAEIFAEPLVRLLVPNFEGETLALTVAMTRIALPAQLAFYIGGLLQATLFVREIFWTAALAPLVYNLGIILGGVFLSPLVGIQGFSYGVLAGAVLGPLALPLWAARREVRFRFRFSITDRGFVEFILLSLPLMIGVSLLSADEWLYRYFGSAQESAISRLDYARKLMLVFFAMLGQATGQAALPYLTRLYHEGRKDAMGRMLAVSGQRLAFFAVAVTGGIVAAAQPMVNLVYQRGAFTPADARETAFLLTIISVALVSWSLQAVLVRGFYAMKDTLTPMIIGTSVFALSVPLYYGLFNRFGAPGLAAAGSIGISINALITIAVYRRRTRALPLRPFATGAARGLLFAVPCGLAAAAAGRIPLPAPFDAGLIGNGLRLVLMGAAYALAAAPLAALVKPPEFYDLAMRLRSRFLRRTGKAPLPVEGESAPSEPRQ